MLSLFAAIGAISQPQVKLSTLVIWSSLLAAACEGTTTGTAPSAQSSEGVTVLLTTTDLQAFVNAHPEGTTFFFQPGTYRLAGPVLAKSRDRFVGQPGTVLDGQNSVPKGIWGNGGLNGQRDVVVQGMTFANFTGTAVVTGWYWTVSQNEMRDNLIGVSVNSYSTLDHNRIHDNRQYGIVGGPGTDLLITNNELASNNSSRSCGGACAGDAGGSKIVGSLAGTLNLVWRNNNVHDNVGPGIWSDGNVRSLYEGNVVSNNSGAGILHELSWNAIIRNNILTNNASESIGRSCWWGGNLTVNTSSDVEAYGNTITGDNGANGICAISADRNETSPFPSAVKNFYAHDNIVSMTGSATSGHVKNDALEQAVANNRFAHNAYRVPDPSRVWWTWPTVPTATWAAWRAAGQDPDGTVNPW